MPWSHKHLTKNTIVKIKGHEAGIPHYYTSKSGVEKLLKPFEIIEFSYDILPAQRAGFPSLKKDDI